MLRAEILDQSQHLLGIFSGEKISSSATTDT